MMSKNLRLLLVPLLLLAPSHVLRAQEEVEETEVVETEEPVQQETSSEQEDETATDQPDQKEEPQEVAPEQSEPEQQPEAQEEPQEEVEQQEESAPEQEAQETEEATVEESETPQDDSQESPKWEQGDVADESSEQADDTPDITPKKYGEDEVMGIDTVDIPNPQGNWLYKRVWWERAEAKFERIREVVGKIMEVRTGFFAKRAELDKSVLDPFYIKIGMSQGELQEILNEMVSKADRLLDAESNDRVQEKLEEEKRTLESLQKQVQVVVTQDEEVEKAILMLVEQITKVRSIEQQAWQDFKAIARVLDDRKARELFYKVDAAWRNVKELQQYIEQTFAGSFDALVEKVKKEVEKVNQEMNALKETGAKLKQGLLGVQQEQLDMEDEEEPEPKGFFTRYIIDPVVGLFKAVWSVITWPYRALFGSTPSDEDMDDEDEMEEPEQVAEEPEQVTEEVEVTQQEDAQQDDEAPEIQEQVKVAEEPEQE